MYPRSILYLFFLICMSAGCDAKTDSPVNSKQPPTKSLPERTVEIGSLDDLMQLFDQLNYTPEAWQAGIKDVPRIYITNIPERWRDNSPSLPVEDKKRIFFRVLAPLVLKSNEKILMERKRLLALELNRPESESWLQEKAQKYGLDVAADEMTSIPDELRSELALRMDIVPVSLVLAQAAEESGWGTSRFSVEGNALFGQWDFSGKGMVPQQQRKELGNYGIARFDSPQQSVDAYMLNLNTHRSYQRLRDKRAELRKHDKPIRGLDLAQTLDKYSERGMDYVDSIKFMINHNNLAEADSAVLTGAEIIYLQP